MVFGLGFDSPQLHMSYVLKYKNAKMEIVIINSIVDGHYHNNNYLAWKSTGEVLDSLKMHSGGAVWTGVNCNLDSYYLLKNQIECTVD